MTESKVDSIIVQPNPVRAGGTVRLSTRSCGTCTSATVDLSLMGGGTVTLVPTETGKALTATATIKPTLPPKVYYIEGTCADGSHIQAIVNVREAGPGSFEDE